MIVVNKIIQSYTLSSNLLKLHITNMKAIIFVFHYMKCAIKGICCDLYLLDRSLKGWKVHKLWLLVMIELNTLEAILVTFQRIDGQKI